MKKNKSTTKKTWRKPKLTVLVRGTPEEMVLATGCKRVGAFNINQSGVLCSVAGTCQDNTAPGS